MIIFSSRGVCSGQPRTDRAQLYPGICAIFSSRSNEKFVLRLVALSVRDYDVLLAPFWPLFGRVQC